MNERIVDRLSGLFVLCTDPGCPGWARPAGVHFDMHNPPCARPFVAAADGGERLCAHIRGHDGDCGPRL